MGRKKQPHLSDLDRSDDQSNKISSTNETLKKEVEKQFILALDISTSCTGICILDEELNLVVLDYIKLTSSSLTNLWDKVDRGIEEIRRIVAGRKIKKIFVEANAKMFMPGFSSADTILTLAKINGIFSYLSHKAFQAPVIDVNVSSARKAIGFKSNKTDKRPKKEQVFSYVIALHPEFPWKKYYPVSGKNKGQETFTPENKDACDAWVIAKGGALLNPK